MVTHIEDLKKIYEREQVQLCNFYARGEKILGPQFFQVISYGLNTSIKCLKKSMIVK